MLSQYSISFLKPRFTPNSLLKRFSNSSISSFSSEVRRVLEILDFKKAREKFEKEFLEKAIARNKGNITQAAMEIGISRPTIYEMIKKYDILELDSYGQGHAAAMNIDSTLLFYELSEIICKLSQTRGFMPENVHAWLNIFRM